jgi:hypothetical protein
MQDAEVIQNHQNLNVRATGQGEAMHRKYNRLKLGGGLAYTHLGICCLKCKKK